MRQNFSTFLIINTNQKYCFKGIANYRSDIRKLKKKSNIISIIDIADIIFDNIGIANP